MLDVIGAGVGRTGTLSLKAALEHLGFGPCYHGIEIMRHPEYLARWEAVADGHRDWEWVFAGYRATVDFPAAALWRELAAAYPDAKLILTIRDPKRWYASLRDTDRIVRDAVGEDPHRCGAAVGSDGVQPSGDDLGPSRARVERFDALMRRLLRHGPDLHDEQAAIAAFERHIEEVRRDIPAERLLVYDVAQGWQPLCEFLDVPLPAGEPFPRLNDRAAFKKLIPQLIRGDGGQPTTEATWCPPSGG